MSPATRDQDRIATAVDRFAAVGLAELVDQAGLLTRVDRKYALAAADLAMVLDLAPGGTRVLEIDGRRSFGYASTYLDTADRVSYRGAALRRRRRFKVRTRTYLDSGDEFLEVKTRSGTATVKTRLPGRHVLEHRLTEQGERFVAETLRTAGIEPDSVPGLRPALATTYRRATLLLPDGAGRVTVDRRLSWVSLPDGETVATPLLAIVETKSAGRAGEMDRLLWSLGVRPARLSKFATGLAALHPELPRNRWARTLRRHF